MAVHTNEATLLAAICAAPDDDMPRLVYADWLLERDDPRGEFIGLQIQRAKDRARRGGRKREDELLDEHGERWREPLRAWGPPHTEFERGFIFRTAVTRINDEPAWALVRECNVPPTKPRSPATNLVKVTHCDPHSFVAMSKLAEPLAIEDFTWGGPANAFDKRALAAFARITCLPKLRRLQVSTEQSSIEWVFRVPCTAKLEELAFGGVVRNLAHWRDELAATPIARFIVGDRPLNWRMGTRVGLERDATGTLSRLIVLAPATPDLSDEIRRAIDSLPNGALTAAHVFVETTVWKASERARAGLARVLHRHGVEPVFEKTQK